MIAAIIPVRFASTRFPGKPLIDILGKSMIERVFEQVSKSKLISEIIIATDDDRIVNHVKKFGGKVILTNPNHFSGTDRCNEAAKTLKSNIQYIINLQGDEPFISPYQIDEMAIAILEDSTIQIATQMIAINSPELLFNTGEVKIVLNHKNEALYFSRNPIPFIKNIAENFEQQQFKFYRHVGMYAYRRDILEKISTLKPSALELAESLEQLRWLENGFKIKCLPTNYDSHCVDTPEDLINLLKTIKILL